MQNWGPETHISHRERSGETVGADERSAYFARHRTHGDVLGRANNIAGLLRDGFARLEMKT